MLSLMSSGISGQAGVIDQGRKKRTPELTKEQNCLHYIKVFVFCRVLVADQEGQAPPWSGSKRKTCSGCFRRDTLGRLQFNADVLSRVRISTHADALVSLWGIGVSVVSFFMGT